MKQLISKDTVLNTIKLVGSFVVRTHLHHYKHTTRLLEQMKEEGTVTLYERRGTVHYYRLPDRAPSHKVDVNKAIRKRIIKADNLNISVLKSASENKVDKNTREFVMGEFSKGRISYRLAMKKLTNINMDTV